MKNIIYIIALYFIFITLIQCTEEDLEPQPYLTRQSTWQHEIELLKQSVAKLRDFEMAKAEGYNLDATGYRSQMGHHFVNQKLLDDKFDLRAPEILLFIPDDSGQMVCVAVEYAVPIPDITNPSSPPEGFTGHHDVWEINTEFNMWTLHVWIELENPNGIFNAKNPSIP